MPLPDFETLEPVSNLPDFESLKPYDEEREKKREALQTEARSLRRWRTVGDIGEQLLAGGPELAKRIQYTAQHPLEIPDMILTGRFGVPNDNPNLPSKIPLFTAQETENTLNPIIRPILQTILPEETDPMVKERNIRAVEERIGEMGSQMTTAPAVAALATGIPGIRAFAAQGAAEIPATIARIRDAANQGDVSGVLQGSVDLTAQAGTAYGGAKIGVPEIPRAEIPDVSGRTLSLRRPVQPPIERPPIIELSTPFQAAAIRREAGRETAFEPSPRAPEARLTVLQEIRNAGAKTKAEIQKLFPKRELTREEAADLRDQAFPKEAAQQKETDASKVSTSTEVYGDVRPQPKPSVREMPAEVSGEGVQSQAALEEPTRAAAPVAEETSLPVSHEQYVAEQGVEWTQRRIKHLNKRFEEELAKRPVDQTILNGLIAEADNLRKAIEPKTAEPDPLSLTPEEQAIEQARVGEAATGEKPIPETEWLGKPISEWEKIDPSKLPATERASLSKSLAVENKPSALKKKITERTQEIRKAQGLAKDVRAKLESGAPEEGGFINTEIFRDILDIGKSVFERGMDFARWSGEMLKHLGEKARDYIAHAWDKIVGNAPADHEAVGKEIGWTVKPQEAPAVKLEGMPPEMAEAFKKKFEPQIEYTDRRTGSTTEGITFYVPKGASRETVLDAYNRKLNEQGPRQGLAAPLRTEPKSVGAEAGFFRPGEIIEKLDQWRKAFSTRFSASSTRKAMDQLIDAGDTLANVAGGQSGNHVRAGIKPIEDEAASAIIAAKFDPANLPTLLQKAVTGQNETAQKAIQYAINNYPAVEPIARRGQSKFDEQIQRENTAGIQTEYHENYLPGIYDQDLWMGSGRPYIIGGKGGGLGSRFKKGKTFDSPFDALENPRFKPKTLKLSELVEHRVRSGERMVNRIAWGDAMRNIADPTDGKPVITSLERRTRPSGTGFEVAPIGYEPREILPGVRVAVHEGYGKLFDALTGESKIAEFEPGGLPVGTMALEGAGAIKHGLLLFDTYHASRIMQKQFFLTGEVGYKKGLSLLEYSDADLARAIRAGEITADMAAYARANRGRANLLMENGLNVGRIQEALYNSVVRKLPIVGTFNKWVFEKMTRGAMLQSALLEFDRIKAANPDWSDVQVARKASRDLNAYFGNLGRQGIFKSKTFQDAARLVGLAPQWFESMARSELGAYKQIAADPILQRRLTVGSLGRGMAGGLLAYFVASQLINLATRRQFTFQNEEKGHKLDAWIPDISGKSKGFWLSPFGVVAELTHDLMKYAHSTGSYLEAASRILANKASPYWRTGKVLLTGRDYKDHKLQGWDRIKESGKALLPIPIAASTALQESKPGQIQRQATASLGVKTDPVTDPRIEKAIRLKNRVEALTPKLKKLPLSQRERAAIKELKDFPPEERQKAILKLRREGVFTYR